MPCSIPDVTVPYCAETLDMFLQHLQSVSWRLKTSVSMFEKTTAFFSTNALPLYPEYQITIKLSTFALGQMKSHEYIHIPNLNEIGSVF